VVAVALGVTRCSAERDAAVPALTPMTTPSWETQPPPAALGSLTAGTTSLFDAARSGDRGLVALAGQRASGHAVPVQSVAADEGFWIGADADDRVWVQLTGSGESAVTITEGELLDLGGPIVPHGPDFAHKAGVTAAEGADQLTREGAHLEVDPSQVEVVGTR